MALIYISKIPDKANMQEKQKNTVSYLMRNPGNRSKPGESRIKKNALVVISKQEGQGNLALR
jgi:hypothetical protein